MVDNSDAPKSMADRHRDEIRDIIDACESSVAPHKEIAHWTEASGKPKPVGHNPTTVGQATKAISAARAACSKAIANACTRHRFEANVPIELTRVADDPFKTKEPEEIKADIAVGHAAMHEAGSHADAH